MTSLTRTRHPVSTAWALTGSLFGVVLVVALNAPAQWLANAIAIASNGHVLLQAPRGTVWNGSAQLLLAGGESSAGAVQLPDRLSWTLTPHWLGARATISAPHPVRLSVAVKNPSTLVWTLAAAQFKAPADILQGLGSPWNTLQLAGALTLTTPPNQPLSGTWSTHQGWQDLTGLATLEAAHIQTALSTVRPLGSYRLTLQGPVLKLETPQPDDALQLSGTGTIGQAPAGAFSFSGEATAALGKEAVLSHLLHIIGQKQTSTDGRLRAALRIG
jgi:general secretion pathway protein N